MGEEIWKSAAYVKDNSIHNITPLQKYSDGSEKVIYYSNFNKHVYLAKGEKSNTLEGKYGIQWKFAMSRKEFIDFVNSMSVVDVNATDPCYVFSKGKNWKKQHTRIVCKHDANGNLCIMRQYLELKKTEPSHPKQYEQDPDPVDDDDDTVNVTELTQNWKDEFERFWISKKDPWRKICKKIRGFLRDSREALYEIDEVGAELFESNYQPSDDETVDDSVVVEESGDENDFEQPKEQSSRKSPRKKLGVEKAIEKSVQKRKSSSTSKPSTSQYKRIKKVNNDVALLILFEYMKQSNSKAAECIARYNEQMIDAYKNEAHVKQLNDVDVIDYVFDILKIYGEKKLDEMYDKVIMF